MSLTIPLIFLVIFLVVCAIIDFYPSAKNAYEKAYFYEIYADFDKAILWYTKVAKMYEHRAQYNLGVMYKNGYGVEKNIDEAVKWYRKAADQGNEFAKAELEWLGK